MDKLSLQFAEAAALQAVDNCTELDDLKDLTRQLVKGHFQSRAYICLLMQQQLEGLSRVTPEACPALSDLNKSM